LKMILVSFSLAINNLFIGFFRSYSTETSLFNLCELTLIRTFRKPYEFKGSFKLLG